MIQIKRLHLLVQCITYRCRGGKSDRADGNLSSVPAKQEREREREERRERGKRKKLVGVFSYSGRVPFLPLLALFQLFSLPAALSYLFHQLILRFTHFVSLSLRSHFQKISSLLLSFSPSFFSFFFFFFFFFFFSLIFSTDFQIPTWLAA